jgi:hypothetical protein
MKKSIYLLILLFFSAIVVTSCKKDDNSNEPFVNGSATINGTAYINLDLTNDTLGTIYEKVPTGTVIYAKINSKDLVEFPSNSVNYGDLYFTSHADANGQFTFTIPSNTKEVSVIFSSDDFKANQIQADTTIEEKVFYLPTGYNESIHNGVTKFTEVYFSEK